MKKLLRFTAFCVCMIVQLVLMGQNSITETMGSAATGTSIATHQMNNGFDNDDLIFGGNGTLNNSPSLNGTTFVRIGPGNNRIFTISGFEPNAACNMVNVSFLVRRNNAAGVLEVQVAGDNLQTKTVTFSSINAIESESLNFNNIDPSGSLIITFKEAGAGRIDIDDVTISSNGTGCSLPIELLSFTGTQQNNAIQLKWETATEKENAYMAIEASKDGVHFVEIGQRKGAGTSLEPNTYSFMDINPFTGINYYRLRQVDLDGKPTYHNIIAVKYEGKSVQGIKIAPTLVSTDFTLVSENPMPAGSTVQIVDTKGSVVQQLLIDAETSQKTVNVAALPTGIYFATVKTGNTLQTLRFVRL